MNHEFMDALEQVEREKGISKEILLDAIETALASAYKRDQKAAQSIEVRIEPETGSLHVYTHKTVVEEVEDDKNEICLEEAQRINIIYELGDLVEFEIFPKEFGRIAAQTAKQVVVQRIREAERSNMYNEFSNRVGDLITGVVQRFEQRNIFIDLGRIEGILPANEQMPNERYEQGMRIKTFVVEVKKTTKGPQVLLSRSRSGLLKRLFELEVPEIQEGLVEIKSVSREPGYRSKIAVHSRDPQIDPVGSCVGARGIRVQMIVRELKGEKIDVAAWSSDPIEFIINALSPAKVSDVKILPSKKTAVVIVPDFQLSLAIGKEGQNARLAAKLTGWKIDIKSQSQAEAHAEEIEQLIREEIGFREFIRPAVEKTTTISKDVDETPESDYPGETETPASAREAIEVTQKPETPVVGHETLIEPAQQPETEVYKESVEEDSDVDDITPSVLEVEDEEEEEKEVPQKKKVKKGKTAPKHLARLEVFDDSSDDNEYFFDILEERQSGKKATSSTKNNNANALALDDDKNTLLDNNEENEAGGGFTIGQLLATEMTQKKTPTPKGTKKGD